MQAAVAAGPHLHAASLTSLYLRHTEFREERGSIAVSNRKGYGITAGQRQDASAGQRLGKHLESVAFTH